MDCTGSEEHVDSRLLSFLQGFVSARDIAVIAARQSADRRTANHISNLTNRLEVAWRRDRKTGFDDIHTQFGKCMSNFQFFSQVHARAGRLFTVA